LASRMSCQTLCLLHVRRKSIHMFSNSTQCGRLACLHEGLALQLGEAVSDAWLQPAGLAVSSTCQHRVH
jgi:hypothetical protein